METGGGGAGTPDTEDEQVDNTKVEFTDNLDRV